MDSILICNFDEYAKVLRYNSLTGSAEEILRESLPNANPEAKGFYIPINGHVFGVYPSPTGPICFFDQQRFTLAPSRWHITILEEQDENECLFFFQGQQAFSFRYKPTPYRSYDNWSLEDEDVDFCFWLKKSMTDPHFYSYYTVPSP